jgi:hypothetical protein
MAFVLRIPPPRPTFPADITDAEKALMGAHAEYWKPLVAEGIVVVYGPVMDPGGWWGIAIVRTDEARAREIAAADPAGKISPVQVFPMRMAFPVS